MCVPAQGQGLHVFTSRHNPPLLQEAHWGRDCWARVGGAAGAGSRESQQFSRHMVSPLLGDTQATPPVPSGQASLAVTVGSVALTLGAVP